MRKAQDTLTRCTDSAAAQTDRRIDGLGFGLYQWERARRGVRRTLPWRWANSHYTNQAV